MAPSSTTSLPGCDLFLCGEYNGAYFLAVLRGQKETLPWTRGRMPWAQDQVTLAIVKQGLWEPRPGIGRVLCSPPPSPGSRMSVRLEVGMEGHQEVLYLSPRALGVVCPGRGASAVWNQHTGLAEQTLTFQSHFYSLLA